MTKLNPIGNSGPPQNGLGDGLAIYIHWPFCSAKCPYCDFNSHVRHKPVDQTMMAAAFCDELQHYQAETGHKTVTSIFFGGGTPSLMEISTVDTILQTIHEHWNVDPSVEITLEANPTSVEAERFAGYRDAGVNRLSLGIQSLRDETLKFLGRQHSASQAQQALEIACSVFGRVSFDLIYALPHQSIQHWTSELGEALQMAGDHLSLYQLTIERGTPFFKLWDKGLLKTPDSDYSAELYEVTQELLNHAGMPAYEISNHARSGHQCLHNLNYWHYRDYLGIGPGAHGRIGRASSKFATFNVKHPESWWQQVSVSGHGRQSGELLSPQDAADEYLLMGMRLKEGISLSRYEAISGTAIRPERIDFLAEHGLVERVDKVRLRATPQGFLLLDAVIADLAC